MEGYFDKKLAVVECSGGRIETTLEAVACRYIGANPRYDYTARPYFTSGIIRDKDYRYAADFAEVFPDAADGSYVYCWGKYWAGEDGALKFTLIPKGPVKVWMNQALVYGTDAVAERYDNNPLNIDLPVGKGWNHLVLRFTRTKAGFGAEFGTWLGKLDYYFFRGSGRAEFSGMDIEGFDYTMPFAEPLADLSPESLARVCLPLKKWTDEEKGKGVFGRIISEADAGDKAAARTDLFVPAPAVCAFRGTYSGDCTVYLEGKSVQSHKGSGSFQFEAKLEAGRNSLAVVSECPGRGQCWDFTLENEGKADVSPVMKSPFLAGAAAFAWIYAGPFCKTQHEALAEQAGKAFDKESLVGAEGERTWWRLDLPSAWVRLYNENPLYGHWNYPLGVTLYGLIETSRLFMKDGLNKAAGSAIGSYVRSHGVKSVRTLGYALFDKEHFGGATAVHHLLTSIDSLDDCGSFGALALELAKDHDKDDHAFFDQMGITADYTADHILKKQDRLPEGCFYRYRLMHHFHNDTMWADDLYMSVPFLCRYAAYKNDPDILDTAAVQFEGFKKYLFMEDKKLMAHVYDFLRDMNTGIPWGRGNGWTIFSLTELLMVLPENHPRREFLLGFFRTLAEGYLACQDENGMWHQVLDMPSSYIESSCTAMFICAFSRGIRYGWFDESEDTTRYRIAAEKAWEALEHYSIDSGGNVYGVCRGSEFSFNRRYYAEHLLPRLNDTHGIGIILLAGVELLKLRNCACS